MNAVVIEVRRGKDGKLYPPRMPTPEPERSRARLLAHNLVHRDGLSIRQAQRVMREQYGCRRSLGIIHADLRDYVCPRCTDQPARAARPQQHQPEPGRGRRQQGTTGGGLAQSVLDLMEGE